MDSSPSWAYALFSAHLHRYLPTLKWDDHLRVYEKWKAVHTPKPIVPALEWDGPFVWEWGLDIPHIICLYHLGMHAQIPRILADHGVCFDILMDREVFEKQETQLLQMQAELNRNALEYRFLMSDDPQVLLKARTAIKQGKHLLVFADGNSGTVESLDKKVRIDFLDADIYVRKGIALLSFLLQVPVLPIAHEGRNSRYQLYAGEQISSQPDETRECYFSRCMQQLYDFLAVEIREFPWKWECWSYLHEMNCYEITAPNGLALVDEGDVSGLIAIELGGRKGIFYRKHFCYVLG